MKKKKYHFTLCRKAWNFTKRFHGDKFRIICACILIKIKIYAYFCYNIVFFEGKTNKSSFVWHRRDRQYASANERCVIHYKFIFITPPASIQINLKTLSSICGSTPNIYLILTHWWAPGETQELMTTRMYSSLFRGGGRGESNLSNYYTGPMFIKNDASSGTTRCWSKASCIDITNAQLKS